MPSSACRPQGAQGAAAPPYTLAGQLHPATTSHARSAWTPPPQTSPPRAPPRRRLRPSAGSAVSPSLGGGPRSTSSHFVPVPAGTRYQLRGVSLTHTHIVHPGASHIQGFLLPPHPKLPVLGSLQWREDSAPREDPAAFLRLVRKGVWPREPRNLVAELTRWPKWQWAT